MEIHADEGDRYRYDLAHSTRPLIRSVTCSMVYFRGANV